MAPWARPTWRRVWRAVLSQDPSPRAARGLSGRGGAAAEESCASTSGRSFEEAAAAARGGSGAAVPAASWLDPLRRPVHLSQGTLALLLLGSVALGSQVDRAAHAQQGGAPGGDLAGGLREAAAGLLPRLHAQPAAAAAAPPPSSAPSAVPLSGCLSPYFIADAAAKASPAVVNIQVQATGGLFPVGSSGSGFFVDSDGVLLTNAHVVADPVARHKLGGPGAGITVTLQDGRAFPARLLASDAVSDIAVLKVDAHAPLPAARLGTSARLRAGEWVVALGSPLSLQNSVTAGIVSCVDRKAVELGLAGAWSHYIQTDAAISRGSSGGPLVSLAGEVVGITCMKALAADGVSFAIPIDEALAVSRQLLELGRVARPYIGIKMLQLNAANAAQLRSRDPLFPDASEGIVVMNVNPDSPAARAGLRPGDVIVGFGRGAGPLAPDALTRALSEHIGRPLELRVLRSRGEAAALQVTAVEAPSA